MTFINRISLAGLVVAMLALAACPNSGTEGQGGTAVDTGGAGGGSSSAGSTPAGGWTGDAIDFAITGFDGGSGMASDYAGKPLVVNFWAAW